MLHQCNCEFNLTLALVCLFIYLSLYLFGKKKSTEKNSIKIRKQLKLIPLTLYGPNSFFHRFSGHNLR